MHWRPFRKADLPHCLELEPASFGDHIVGRRHALRVWNGLLEHPSSHGPVIEAARPIADHQIVGCGMGIFVTAAFADAETASPRPGLNSRIVAAVAAGEPILLGREAIAKGNAAGGLDFVNLYGTWR